MWQNVRDLQLANRQLATKENEGKLMTIGERRGCCAQRERERESFPLGVCEGKAKKKMRCE